MKKGLRGQSSGISKKVVKIKISIVGTGYVGLITGVSLANIGHEVICVDSNKEKVDRINDQKEVLYEPGLKDMLDRVFKKGAFTATTNLKNAILNSEVTFICVGTPSDESGGINLKYVKEVSKDIGKILKDKEDYHLVIMKSTVVPGTSKEVVFDIIKKESKKSESDFGICMNPEFLREGKAISDFNNPDRIVIGSLDKKAGDMAESIYSGYDAPIIRTNLTTAEMIKYSVNSFLAVTISFSNEMANICEKFMDVDIVDVMEGLSFDKRLNPRVNGDLVNPGILAYLRAGVGFGGSCFPKDVKAIINTSDDKGYNARILKSAIQVNHEQKAHVVELLKSELKTLEGKTIAVFGLAFKPETDDMRESPAIGIIKNLILSGAKVKAYDPVAMENAKSFWLKDSDIEYCGSVEECLEGSDACIMVTSWKEFYGISPETFRKCMRNPVLLDGRRIYDAKKFKKHVKYIGVGLK